MDSAPHTSLLTSGGSALQQPLIQALARCHPQLLRGLAGASRACRALAWQARAHSSVPLHARLAQTTAPPSAEAAATATHLTWASSSLPAGTTFPHCTRLTVQHAALCPAVMRTIEAGALPALRHATIVLRPLDTASAIQDATRLCVNLRARNVTCTTTSPEAHKAQTARYRRRCRANIVEK